jgi:uncharacterized protein
MSQDRTVVVLGASGDPERYAYKAVARLKEKGYRVVPVNPKGGEILGLPVKASLSDVSGKVDTLTVYLSPERSTPLAAAIRQLKPGRVILNPGAENPALEAELEQAGIPCLKACTLVLLSTAQF